MLHVSERAYFQAIGERMQDYNVVLYELIADEANTRYENGVSHQRVLERDVMAPEADKLAAQFAFTTQLCMDFQTPN
jgi:hypothetical protein